MIIRLLVVPSMLKDHVLNMNQEPEKVTPKYRQRFFKKFKLIFEMINIKPCFV